MNKYLVLIIIGVVILGGGIFYRAYFLPEESRPFETGVVREVRVVAKKNEWRFWPETLEAVKGDRIIMTLVNEDDYDHGIGIDVYGISQRMPANSITKAEFVVSQEGDFPFFCSVPCGEGIVDGEKRTHFDMVGKLHVRSIVSSTE